VKKTRVLAIEEIHLLKASSFDTVLMMGNNFGLFGGFQKARRLLRQIHRITTPNALLIAQTLDPYQTKDPLHLNYHRINRKKGRMSGQIRLRVRHNNMAGPWMDYLLVSEKELERILQGTGWKIEKVIHSKGSIYIAVMKKEKTDKI
jgi:hypothetical protein